MYARTSLLLLGTAALANAAITLTPNLFAAMPRDDRKRDWVFLLEASLYMASRRVELIRGVNHCLAGAVSSDRHTRISLFFFREGLLPVVAAAPLEDMPELCEDDLFPSGECALSRTASTVS